MSNIERGLAEGIATNLSDTQIESTENNPDDPRPGFRLKVNALKRHLSSDVPDEQYAFQQIAIRALVQSILNEHYRKALIIQTIDDINRSFDSTVSLLDTVGVLPEKDPARSPLFEEPIKLLRGFEQAGPPIFKSRRRDIL